MAWKNKPTAPRGETLERQLDVFHQTLAAKGWYLHRTAARGATPQKKPPDYLLGSPQGQFFMFDAKSVKKPDWYVSLLSEHQFADLNAFTGTAGIYLRTSEGDCWLPFQQIVKPAWTRWFRERRPDGSNRGVTLRWSDGIPITGMDWTKHVVG